MKFVLQYVAGFLIFAGSFVGLSVAMNWSTGATIAGVAFILLATIVKFTWDLTGFNGGYSS